jgi:surfactin synthase thioesterase subunit
MTMSDVRVWFPYRKAGSGAEVFAFPHAGAGSTVFSALRQAFSGTELCLVPAVLPGRERRLRDAPHHDMESLLAEFEDMATQDGFSAFTGKYALLGHCSGALVAYEIARLLERSPCRNPALLVVISSLPPQLVRDTGISRLPTRELFARTASMGGTPDALLNDPDFLEMLERPLRADWQLSDGYRHRLGVRLATPVLAICGENDPELSAAEVELWREWTIGDFSTMELQSDHWALNEATSAVLARTILSALRASGRA